VALRSYRAALFSDMNFAFYSSSGHDCTVLVQGGTKSASNATSMSTPLFSIPADVLAAIVARPEKFLTAYSSLGGGTDAAAYVRSQLGGPFAALQDAGCLATFATVVSYNAVPAGTSPLDPTAATLHELLTAPALAAQHRCRLSALLSLLGNPVLIPPELPAGSKPKATLHFLAWLSTVPLNTGPHTQLVIANVFDQAYLLLDPQYAYALRIPFVGAGPQSSLTLAENVATMMQTPLPPDNLALLDPAATDTVPQMLQVLLSGALGPQFVDKGATTGADFWDNNIAQVVNTMS